VADAPILDGLAGSYDPVWTAGAEGRFLAGALTAPGHHPLLLVGRVLVLVAFVAPGLAPFFGALHASNGALRAPIMVGIGALALLTVSRFVGQRR
jgi:hypothetical protein